MALHKAWGAFELQITVDTHAEGKRWEIKAGDKALVVYCYLHFANEYSLGK